jgi:hypothetical protein
VEGLGLASVCTYLWRRSGSAYQPASFGSSVCPPTTDPESLRQAAKLAVHLYHHISRSVALDAVVKHVAKTYPGLLEKELLEAVSRLKPRLLEIGILCLVASFSKYGFQRQ